MNFKQFLLSESALFHAIKIAVKRYKNRKGKPDGREYDPQDEYGYSDKYDRKKTSSYISRLKHIEKLKGKSDDDYH